MADDFIPLKRIIDDVVGKIIVNDQMLIRKGQEWALSNKFGMYLFPFFSGWHVDCEYNRIGFNDDLKRNSSNAYKRPDVIIHRRGFLDKENNLLWIEVKIDSCDINKDIIKLKEFTSIPRKPRMVQYKYGLSVSFLPITKMIWIENGAEK